MAKKLSDFTDLLAGAEDSDRFLISRPGSALNHYTTFAALKQYLNPPQPDLDENLIFWYKFDGNLTDSSVNNTGLTKYGTGTPSYVTTPLDQAVNLSSKTYGLNVASTSLTNNTHLGFYIAMVVSFSSYNGNAQMLMSQGDPFVSTNRFALERFSGEGGDELRFAAYQDSSFVGNARLRGSAGSAFPFVLPNNTPALIEAYYNPALGANGEGQLGLAMNNSIFNTFDLFSVPDPLVPLPMWLGAKKTSESNPAPVLSSIFEGSIDLAAAWSVPFPDLSPTSLKRAALWNNGNFKKEIANAQEA